MKNKQNTNFFFPGFIAFAVIVIYLWLTSCTVNHYYVFVIKESPADEIHLFQPLQYPQNNDWGITPYFINNQFDTLTSEQLQRMCQVPGINNWLNEPILIDSSKIIIDHEK